MGIIIKAKNSTLENMTPNPQKGNSNAKLKTSASKVGEGKANSKQGAHRCIFAAQKSSV